MKSSYLLFLMTFYFFTLQADTNCQNADGFFLPAEFDRQAAIWISWSSDEAKKGYPYASVQTEIIQQLAPYVQMKVVVGNKQELYKAKLMIGQSSLKQYQISYFVLSNDAIWLRDIGPIFLINDFKRFEIVAFNFNNWGHLQFEERTLFNLENHRLNKEFSRSVADLMGLHVLSTKVVSEGGNLEHNGQGTMIVVKAVEEQRNRHLTQAQLSEEYKRVLGIKKIIRLTKGMYQDEDIEKGPIPGPEGFLNAYTLLGNSGHVDAFCRFVGPNTILLAEVDPKDAENDPIAYENSIRLEENFTILKNAIDANGDSFNILRMPATDSFYITLTPEDPFYKYLLELNFPVCTAFPTGKFPYQEKMTFLLPTSYLNFIIVNEVILISKYWREGYSKSIKAKDEKAMHVLKTLFPQKHIIAIDVLNINICGGGIHCLTQNEPFR